MSNSTGVTFNFLSSKYFRNILAMSQTPFIIKFGKLSKIKKKKLNPLSLLLAAVKKHDYKSLNS